MKCKYAGDKNDVECVNCNGLTMIVNDKEVMCKDVCMGFECENEKQPILPPTTETPTENQAPKEEFVSKTLPLTIGAKSGISKEINGMWYKFEAWEEREVPANTEVDLEQEKRALFDKLNQDIDKQVMDVIKSMKGN